MKDNYECDECGHKFTCSDNQWQEEADTYEEETCDIRDGQYVEFSIVRCPKCEDIVTTYG